MSNDMISENTRLNIHRPLDLRMLHPVKILGGPVMQVMVVDVVIIVENTFRPKTECLEK